MFDPFADDVDRRAAATWSAPQPADEDDADDAAAFSHAVYDDPTVDQPSIEQPSVGGWSAASSESSSESWPAGDPPAPPAPPRRPGEPAPKRRSPVLVGLVAVSLAASGFAVARATGNKTTIIRQNDANVSTATVSTSPTTVSTTKTSSEPIAAVAASLAPSVVQIETSQGLGSGFIYDSAGHVLTAAHVVTGAGNTVTVRLADGSSQTGTVVGADQSTDVAVVKINLSGTSAKVASLALNDPLQVGQTAIAIGSPFGLEQTVTAGIVSAVDRAMQTTNSAIGMVQTDAPINPGNSGGPLADLSGRVIGINDQIESSSGSSSGVGFAIPIDTAKAVADKIVAGRPVTFAFLGVQTQASGQGVVGNGALIVGVESGSPAERAGVKQGDIVTKIGNTAIDGPTTLSAAIRQASPGDVVKISILRNGASRTLTVTLGSTSAA